MNSDDLAFAGLARQAETIRSGEVSSEETVKASLERIERHDGLLNAFRILFADEALEAARKADANRSDSSRPLNGVPIVVKDDMDLEGQPTRFGSRATSDGPKAQDSEVVRRIRAAGAIVIGKTNVPELTQWPFTETPAFGVTRNPWNTGHTPGGSSGGSAAAVAAGFAGAALGSDGGGSIRIPAACCGLFGIKPQRGLVPVAPKVDPWFGLSVFGPITRSVLDGALLLDAIADRPQGQGPYADAVGSDPGRLRIAFSSKTPLPGPVGSDQKAALERVVGILERIGHSAAESHPAYGNAIPAFVPRYLGGIAQDAGAVENPDLLESRTKSMARVGRLLSGGLLKRAMASEASVSAKLNEVFRDHDLLITPALADQPLPIGKYAGKGALVTFNGVARWTPYAAVWNLTGQPAVNVPVGFDSDGLPLCVQIVGPPKSEALLISVAAQIEAAQPWATYRPDLPA
jgi:amidase